MNIMRCKEDMCRNKICKTDFILQLYMRKVESRRADRARKKEAKFYPIQRTLI